MRSGRSLRWWLALALALAALALGLTGSQGAAWWLWRGDSARAELAYGQALAAYRAASAWNPGDDLPHRRAGEIYLLQGRLELADEALWQAYLRDPASLANLAALGELSLAQGQPAQAATWYRRARQLAPGDLATAQALGRALLAAGQWDQAVAAFGDALSLAPADPQARYYLGLLLASRDVAAARAHLQGAMPGEWAAQAADLLAALDESERAPTPAVRAALLGVAYLRQEQWGLAEASLREAAVAPADQAEALAFLGYALYQQGHLAEAVDTLQRALALDPQDGQARHFLAMAYLRLGWPLQALEQLAAAYAADPASPAIAAEIAGAYAETGAYDWAESWHEQAAKLSGGDPRYLLLQAAFHVNHAYHVQEKGLPAAEQGLEALLPQASPEEAAAAYAILGRGLYLAGRSEESEAALRRALALRPGSAQAWFYLGDLHVRQARWPAARRAYERAADLDGEGGWRERAARELGRLPGS